MMIHVKLGEAGPSVSAIGLGCMGMSSHYGPRADETEAIRTIHRALDLGVNLLDTSASYGDGHNEQLLAKALRGRREQAVLCTKFGIRRDSGSMRIDSSADWARRSCDESLRRLEVDHIDLFYLHRRNPDVPIEQTIGAMADLVSAGKVRHLGVSEVNPQTLRLAHATHPLVALQSEYSLFSRDIEAEILPTCRELGIALVAYSPIGRAMLSGRISQDTQFAADDLRRSNPRFAASNLAHNLVLVERLRTIAEQMGATPAQVAIAWVLAQGAVPIPGTKRISYLEENIAAVDLKLTPDQVERIDEAVPARAVQGERLADWAARLVGF